MTLDDGEDHDDPDVDGLDESDDACPECGADVTEEHADDCSRGDDDEDLEWEV